MLIVLNKHSKHVHSFAHVFHNCWTTLTQTLIGYMSKPRILCLHGYQQTADIFRKRSGAFRKLFSAEYGNRMTHTLTLKTLSMRLFLSTLLQKKHWNGFLLRIMNWKVGNNLWNIYSSMHKNMVLMKAFWDFHKEVITSVWNVYRLKRQWLQWFAQFKQCNWKRWIPCWRIWGSRMQNWISNIVFP